MNTNRWPRWAGIASACIALAAYGGGTGDGGETKTAVVVVADAAAAPQRAASAPIDAASDRAALAPSVDWSHTPRRRLHARQR